MKTKSFKNEYLIIGITITFLTIISFVSCNKSYDKKYNELSGDEIIIEIKNDTNFYNYTSNLTLLITKNISNFPLESNTNSSVVNISDEQKFISLFKEAVEKNNDSKTKISNYMGFQNPIEFWNIRSQINKSLSNLIKKYNFKKITKNQWYNLVKGAKINYKAQANTKVRTFMLNPNNCIEQYSDCIDDANAQYAVESLGCVGWGALGWTVVGGVLFVGCEGLSYYHLTTMKRKCESSYKTCK